MARRFASLFLLFALFTGGAYAVAPVRGSNGVRVEISIVAQDTEVQLERRAVAVFPPERPQAVPAGLPVPRPAISKSLYQRPPPAAR